MDSKFDQTIGRPRTACSKRERQETHSKEHHEQQLDQDGMPSPTKTQ